MEGGLETLTGEDETHFATLIRLTSEEKELFEVTESSWVLIEDSQGFVFSIPADKYESWKN